MIDAYKLGISSTLGNSNPLLRVKYHIITVQLISCFKYLHTSSGKTDGKTDQRVRVCIVMYLVFNTLPRFVIAFLLRGKGLSFTAAVTVSSGLETPKIKSVTASTFFLLFAKK